MRDLTPITVETPRFKIEGISVGGMCTSISVPALNVVLDAGISAPSMAKGNSLFFSHFHLDHVGGLGTYLGIRDLRRNSSNLYCLEGQSRACADLVSSFRSLSETDLKVAVHGVGFGESVKYDTGLYAKPFRTLHRVPSAGWLFSRKKNKLKPEFMGMNHKDIANLRKSGTAITETVISNELAYATDTKLEAVLACEEALTADTLILECTYVCKDFTVAEARNRCHVPLDEIIMNAEKFQNQNIVLMHFSNRYDRDTIIKTVSKRVPAEWLHGKLQWLV